MPIKKLLLYLVASIMLLGGCDETTAEPVVADQQARFAALQMLESYITTSDQLGPNNTPVRVLHFNMAAAEQSSVSAPDIDLAVRLVELSNHISLGEVAFDSESVEFDPDIVELFEAYATGQVVEAEHSHTESEDNDGFSQVQQAVHCGGGMVSPAVCEPYTHSNQVWNTKQEVANHLLSLGYHKTAPHLGSENDYSVGVNRPCGRGVYRFQALIEARGNRFSYKVQRDLNPELWTFLWPHDWWPAYDLWWHRFYCN